MRIFRDGGAPSKHGSHAYWSSGGSPWNVIGRGEYDLWQRRFWEHVIRDESDFARHADYIHYNPVKHGLVTRPVDWRWSSIHRYIRFGLLSPGWAAAPGDGEFGESQ